MRSIMNERTRARGFWTILLTGPVIYGMFIPIAFMDLCISVYQAICFRAYGIPLVSRKKYVRFLMRGNGLPWYDKFHCVYCSYANGVCAYMRAILIETEKYWCPIKYAVRKGFQPPHPQEKFASEGNREELKGVLDSHNKTPQGEA